jgi:hypothetical protein
MFAAPGTTRLWGALVLLGFAAPAFAQSSVTVAWDPSSGSDIAGYRLYQGGASAKYTNVVDTGKLTTATVSGLVLGATYYFAATAYDSFGLESDYSNEIAYTVPAVPSPPNVISLTSPTNGAVCAAGCTIALAVNVTVSGDTVSQVQFFNGTALLGSATNAPYTFAWTKVSPGTYSVWARAVCASGNLLTSAAATVSVQHKAPKLRLSLAAGTSALQPRLGASIVLTATGDPGQAFDVLRSPDLKTWARIGTLTLDATGAGSFGDLTPGKQAIGYYRLQGQ